MQDKGLVWRVEDGRKIHAIDDNWIPRKKNFKAILGLKDGPKPTVDYFMGENREERFMPFDVVDIMTILLGIKGAEDSVYWFYELKGFYLVRSGYHLANRITVVEF